MVSSSISNQFVRNAGLQAAESAKEICLDTDDKKKELAIVNHVLGNILQAQGNLEKAKQAFKESIEIAEAHNDKNQCRRGLYRLGGLYYRQENFTEALQYFKFVAELDKDSYRDDLVFIFRDLSKIFYQKKDFLNAVHAAESARKICLVTDNKKELARTNNRLGKILQAQGRLQDAEQAFQKEIEIAKLIPDQKQVLIGLHSLSRLLKEKGDLEEVQQTFQEAIDILICILIEDKLDKKLSQSWALSIIKSIYFELGINKIIEIARSKEKSFAESNSLPLVAIVLYYFGLALKKAGKLKQAEEILKQSREILEDNIDLLVLVEVLKTLGAVLEKQQKWKEATNILKEGNDLAKDKLQDKLGRAIILNKLVKVTGHQEREEIFNYSKMCFQESIKLGKELGNQHHLAKAYTAMGQIFLLWNSFEEAVEELSKGFKIDENLSNIQGLRIVTLKITDALSKLGKEEEALAYCERALKIAPNNSSLLKLYDNIQVAIATGVQPTFIKTGWVRYIRYNKKEKLCRGRITPDDRSLDITFNEKYIGTESVSQLTRGSLVEVEVEKKHGTLYAKQISLIEDEDDDDFW